MANGQLSALLDQKRKAKKCFSNDKGQQWHDAITSQKLNELQL